MKARLTRTTSLALTSVPEVLTVMTDDDRVSAGEDVTEVEAAAVCDTGSLLWLLLLKKKVTEVDVVVGWEEGRTTPTWALEGTGAATADHGRSLWEDEAWKIVYRIRRHICESSVNWDISVFSQHYTTYLS